MSQWVRSSGSEGKTWRRRGPFKRDAHAVAHDVREGYVSREAAEKLYGVVLDDKCEVKLAETKQLRSKALA